MRRRTFLATGAGALVALAGCRSAGPNDDGDEGSRTGDGSGGGDVNPGEGTATDAALGTPAPGDGVALAEAAIAADLGAQPSRGPAPSEAETVVVEVTDPSCPTCRSFHQQSYPSLEAELIDAGRTAYVVRNVSWVYPWSVQASAALEAVHDRHGETYWELLDHYFDSQGDFDGDNVLEKTETFLSDTPVDGTAVVDAVAAGEYDDAVAADGTAAEDAGATSQPYFFLFSQGKLRTSFGGAQSYDTIRSSLGY